MASTAMQQISEGLSIRDLRKLIGLLNSDEKWRQLGSAMDYSDGELNRISRGMYAFHTQSRTQCTICKRSQSFFIYVYLLMVFFKFQNHQILPKH